METKDLKKFVEGSTARTIGDCLAKLEVLEGMLYKNESALEITQSIKADLVDCVINGLPGVNVTIPSGSDTDK